MPALRPVFELFALICEAVLTDGPTSGQKFGQVQGQTPTRKLR